MPDIPSFFPRRLSARLTEALLDTPAVLLAGPRQSGKTTLARQFSGASRPYLTLDDDTTLMAALNDPVGLLRGIDRVVIDEIQRAPRLLLSIKKSIDEDRRPGRFLLTGSANLMTLPAVADSLAGRMETLNLLPLSQSEMREGAENWLDCVFAGGIPVAHATRLGEALVNVVLEGGYPEVVARSTPRRRMAWAREYVDAILKRDVRDIANIDKLDHLPRLFRGLAHVSGQLCNYSEIGANMGLNYKTVARYLGLFEQMFLLRRLESWAKNRARRLVKTPKLHFIDSGLLAAQIEISSASLPADRQRFGPLLESFVFGELLKHTAVSEGGYQLMYYRDHDQYEVDFVIENPGGQVIGVDVKAAASLSMSDLAGLKRFQAVAGDAFLRGIVLYDGGKIVPMGEKMQAVPLSSLWG